MQLKMMETGYRMEAGKEHLIAVDLGVMIQCSLASDANIKPCKPLTLRQLTGHGRGHRRWHSGWTELGQVSVQ